MQSNAHTARSTILLIYTLALKYHLAWHALLCGQTSVTAFCLISLKTADSKELRLGFWGPENDSDYLTDARWDALREAGTAAGWLVDPTEVCLYPSASLLLYRYHVLSVKHAECHWVQGISFRLRRLKLMGN